MLQPDRMARRQPQQHPGVVGQPESVCDALEHLQSSDRAPTAGDLAHPTLRQPERRRQPALRRAVAAQQPEQPTQVPLSQRVAHVCPQPPCAGMASGSNAGATTYIISR
jgi:hypothetical protein